MHADNSWIRALYHNRLKDTVRRVSTQTIPRHFAITHRDLATAVFNSQLLRVGWDHDYLLRSAKGLRQILGDATTNINSPPAE